MSSYDSVSLGEICDILDRYRKPITKRDRISGPYPYYGASGILDHVADYIFDEPLVLVGEDGAKWAAGENSAFGINGKSWVNNHAHVLRPHRIHLVDDWLVHSLNAIDLTPFVSGITVPKLNQRRLKEIRIPLPPLEEQRRIVSILNRAAKIERLRNQAQERLREFIPALFIRMFGDPVENPMGWKKASLGELSQVQGGLQITKKRDVYSLETPYLRVANVLRDRLDLKEIKPMRVTNKELDRVRLRRGDLLIVEGHGNPAEVGRVAIWDGSIDDCVHQNHLIRARPNRSIVLPEYINAYLNSSSGRQQLLRSGKTTSGLNTISTSNVKDCVLHVPPLELQRRYTQIIEVARSVISIATSSSNIVFELSTALISELLKIDADI